MRKIGDSLIREDEEDKYITRMEEGKITVIMSEKVKRNFLRKKFP